MEDQKATTAFWKSWTLDDKEKFAEGAKKLTASAVSDEMDRQYPKVKVAVDKLSSEVAKIKSVQKTLSGE